MGSGFIKDGSFVDYLSDHQLMKKDRSMPLVIARFTSKVIGKI
jgi:hypothetical protein